MKLTDKSTWLGIATAVVVFIGALFVALDKGFDFWEDHVKAKPAPVPENYIEPERIDITQQTTERLTR